MRNFFGKRVLKFILLFFFAPAVIFSPAGASAKIVPPAPDKQAELANIAHTAYIYGYPLVASYAVMYSTVFGDGVPPFENKFNKYIFDGRLMTPADRTIISPNVDTPYGYVCFDLRAEPVVLTVPDVDAKRYFSVMFNDMYTFNSHYLGKRTTGNKGGTFLIAYKDEQVPNPLPDGIDRVIMSETPLVQTLTRTQLFNQSPAEFEQVKKINAAIKIVPLSKFLGEKSKSLPQVDFPVPPPGDARFKTMDFYKLLDFVLSLCPVAESERKLRESFKKIGLNGDGRFAAENLTPRQEKALTGALQSGLNEIMTAGGYMNFDEGAFFGSREKMMKLNGESIWLHRAVGAYLGIYGNDIEEAYYVAYYTDKDGTGLDSSKHNYSFRFDGKNLPPVDAFWSLTLYGEDKFLVENELNRYIINSVMFDSGELALEKDNSFEILIQKDPPADRRNWLPAPNGKFNVILRLYLPGGEVLNGSWKKPDIVKSAVK